MNKNLALGIACFVFGLVALIHLLRIFMQFEIIASGYMIPMGASYVGFFVALSLCVWMYAALKSK